MAQLTHDQAVQVYKKHAKHLADEEAALKHGIDAFVKGARKYAEKSSRSKDEAALKNLDQKLKDL